MKRLFIWGSFVVVLGLIVWGMVAASNKQEREGANLPLPNKINERDYVYGKPDAPVTLVEYGDFQCPACAVYYPIVDKVVSEYSSSTLRFVFRHFPLPQHGKAMPSAKVSEAAGKQGKFFEMYGLLYENQDEWVNATSSDIVFESYAKKLSLDINKYRQDLNDKNIEDKINSQYKGGASAGVRATPTFFVNGKSINSPQTYIEFKKIIEDASISK